MKRYTKTNPHAICMIPRKAIVWLILSMTIMTIMSLILIEVRRILALKGKNPVIPNPKAEIFSHFLDDIDKSNNSLETRRRNGEDSAKHWTNTKIAWFYDNETIEDLFEDGPNCRKRPFLLILVTSAPENFERRESIRRSWANAERWKLQVPVLKPKILFLAGRSSTKFLNILLKNENDITGDIIIGEYMDTYRNLTTKVMHGFTWALRHCKPAYLLKTDDDCFVNVPLILQFLLKYNPVPVDLYAGKIEWSAPVIRDPNNRWYVSKSEYSRQRYAPYAVGAGYIFSYDVLEKLVTFSDKLHVFPNEDAYVGTVLHSAGVRPTYSERFVTHPGPWQTCNFLYLFVVHRVKASRQNEYKEMANKAIEECPRDQFVRDWV